MSWRQNALRKHNERFKVKVGEFVSEEEKTEEFSLTGQLTATGIFWPFI